ncbi:MAG: hypothetical protein QME58_06555 [Bacteroidota bacterium]|nr:hypothetical protein [Bacteroidota bacterium]
MTKGLAFVEHGIELYQQIFSTKGGCASGAKEQQLRLLQNKAISLGFQLIST